MSWIRVDSRRLSTIAAAANKVMIGKVKKDQFGYFPKITLPITYPEGFQWFAGFFEIISVNNLCQVENLWRIILGKCKKFIGDENWVWIFMKMKDFVRKHEGVVEDLLSNRFMEVV